ncbi:hypothetical protein NDU88_005690 [Pleurodeles waltl]|uniref:L1 transposable element RRM domain-containing protein n=1 Tax=Pleurodeles waltl TaxID=8319 RepID=A0AAV7VME6_PLEWA|nr:hypothetical protein NDU88_005690 [Pleurodeles waltl]
MASGASALVGLVQPPVYMGEEIGPSLENVISGELTAESVEPQRGPPDETNSLSSQSGTLESLLYSLTKEDRQGFLVSQTNQKGIQEVCEALANKMDLLTQQTQALENQVDQLNEAVEKHTREIDELKAKSNQGSERVEALENNARRNNIKLINVPKGSEGEDIKAFVVDLLKQSGAWEGHKEVLSRDMQRVHRDPFRKPPNRVNPRRILVNFLTYAVKEKILLKALSMETLSEKDDSFEVRSNVSHITSNRQWELGKRMEDFKKLGATAQLKFPATMRVMRNNKMYNLRDVQEADTLLDKFKDG